LATAAWARGKRAAPLTMHCAGASVATRGRGVRHDGSQQIWNVVRSPSQCSSRGVERPAHARRVVLQAAA
jgi:hypothetical protein